MQEGNERTLARLPAVDIAYELLKREGRPLHYRDLLARILELKKIPAERHGRAMAEIHTEINLDPRFQYCGQAAWGLREWTEQEGGSAREEESEEADPREEEGPEGPDES